MKKNERNERLRRNEREPCFLGGGEGWGGGHQLGATVVHCSTNLLSLQRNLCLFVGVFVS